MAFKSLEKPPRSVAVTKRSVALELELKEATGLCTDYVVAFNSLEGVAVASALAYALFAFERGGSP